MINKFENLDGIVDIIAVIKKNDQYLWFCSDKIYWLMDYERYAHLFDPEDDDFSERFDIGILDNNNVHEFIDAMSEYQTTFEELNSLFESYIPVDTFDRIFHLFPSVYIDFDKCRLFSVYSELLQIEKFVPKGWNGSYKPFYSHIPDSEKYWVINGHDYSQFTDNI